METKNNQTLPTDAKKSADDEIVENLEVLMNLETLEQAESWDYVIGLSELSEGAAKSDEPEKED